MTRLSVDIDDALNEKLRRYIALRWGLEKFHGKVAKVTREALNQFLDEKLADLKKEKAEEITEE